MPSSLRLLPFLAILFAAPGVLAQEPTPASSGHNGWYFSGKGGPSFESVSNVGPNATKDSAANVVGAFGMAAGYEWAFKQHVPLRTELEFMNRTEVTYDSSPAATGSSGALASTVQNVTTMAKGYWHFPVGSQAWWPFVSGGVGWSHNNVKGQYGSTKVTSANDDLAWSVGAGATFTLGPQVVNDVEFRYVDLGKADWGPGAANLTGDVTATELSFSIRYLF